MSAFFPAWNNDLALAVNSRGKKALVLEKDPVVCGGIKLYQRFQFFEGEWFLDIREGTPWFRIVFVKNPDLASVRQMIRKVILSIPVIVNVGRIDLEYDPATRSLAFDFTAYAADGRKIEGGSGRPFIVDDVEIGDAL